MDGSLFETYSGIIIFKNTLLLYKRILLDFVEYSLDYQDEMQINDKKTTFLII